MPTYTANVPLGGVDQTLADSQPIINANFQQIKVAFDQDHIDFTATGAGKHTAVHFPAAATTGQGTTIGGEIALYSKLFSGTPRLTFAEPSTVPGTSGNQWQISGDVFFNQGAPQLNGGATPLFGGFTMLFGNKTLVAGNNTISFNTQCGMNFPSACVNVQAMVDFALNSVAITNITADGFTAVVTGAAPSMFFIAIGF